MKLFLIHVSDPPGAVAATRTARRKRMRRERMSRQPFLRYNSERAQNIILIFAIHSRNK